MDVKFLVNDDPILSKKLNADGLSFGSKRYGYKRMQEKLVGNKIIGITCHNSIRLSESCYSKDKAELYCLWGFFFNHNQKSKI